jgi:hypothetical protein
MSQENQWPMPGWHDSLPDPDKEAATVRVLLSLAAIYASEQGTATALAEALRINTSTILQARARGVVSATLAIDIEKLLGRDRFPRELFRPDLFLIED